MGQIYLDYNATTPIDPRVADAMEPWLFQNFGNPSSSHEYGMNAREAVENAREKVADLLGCRASEIVFTSGGTESNNHAIRGIASSAKGTGNHIVTSAVEHPAVVEVCRRLEMRGFRTTFVPVDRFGMVDPGEVVKAISLETILVTIMHANNEIGTIQPVREIAAAAREYGIPIHTDAAQSVGKIRVLVDDLGVDMLSIAGHKLYAPKGIGVLYIRNGLVVDSLMAGAGQENGRRPGTENVVHIVGLGEACFIARQELERGAGSDSELRDLLFDSLVAEGLEVRINGHPEKRLPNTASLTFSGLRAGDILSSAFDVAASLGAACHSDTIELSPVLEAMRFLPEDAAGTIRFSTGRFTTRREIELAAASITRAVRGLSG